MKSRKKVLLISTVALSLCAVGLTTAMYFKGETKTINIGGSATTDGAFSLTKVEESTLLTPENPNITIKYKLGYAPASDKTYNQKYIVGNLGFKIGSSINESTVGTYSEDLLNKITVSASVTGYKSGSKYVEEGYNKLTVSKDNNYYEASKDIAFCTDATVATIEGEGAQYLEIKISLNNPTAYSDFVQYVAETRFVYNITLGAESESYKTWYVVGSFNNWDQENDLYKAVPNIAATDQSSYICTLPEALAVNNEFKMKYDGTGTWYPGDNGGNYKVTDSEDYGKGKTTIGFRVETYTSNTVAANPWFFI